MADEQPQKSNNPPSGGGGKNTNRRYFRRRNKGSAFAANSGGAGQAPASQPKDQSRLPADPKPQGNRAPEQRNEQQEKRRKRRRSGNSSSTNRRSASGRRQRRDEQTSSAPLTVVPEPERYREPLDVYVHTHIVRPAYRDAGGDFVSETSFLTERRPPEASIHMERLEEDIRKQLDEYLNRPVVPVKVIFELGDEGWDEEES
ncbi:MAG: hypothetical protein DWI57_10200 [Chloroflexi bacterium]|nr:MAG: hypothetical protein DWI57_10200 [Chloroflexota bacterium]